MPTPLQELKAHNEKIKAKHGHLLAQFKIEVTDKADDVDPDKEHDWRGLTVGWAIAKGLSPTDANDFAVYVRYNTDLA